MGYIHEAWLMNRFEYAVTPPTPSHNPYIVAYRCEVLNIQHYTIVRRKKKKKKKDKTPYHTPCHTSMVLGTMPIPIISTTVLSGYCAIPDAARGGLAHVHHYLAPAPRGIHIPCCLLSLPFGPGLNFL